MVKIGKNKSIDVNTNVFELDLLYLLYNKCSSAVFAHGNIFFLFFLFICKITHIIPIKTEMTERTELVY